MLWYNILKCFHIAHFAISYVVKSNISRYLMSSIRTFRDTFCRRNHQYVVQASKKNQLVELSLFRSSNSIIKEYDLVEENVTKELSDAQFSIRKKWDDNDLTNHESISKTMLRVFVWKAVRIFHLKSNSWIVCFLFENKAWDEATNVLVDVFVNQIRFQIELLESSLCYSCVKFSLWSVAFVDIKKCERLISSVHFIDVKRSRTTHLSISCTFCYTFFAVHHIRSHRLSKQWLFHEILNVKMSIVFSTSLEILFSLYQSRKKWRQNKDIWNNASESIFVYEDRIYYRKRWKEYEHK